VDSDLNIDFFDLTFVFFPGSSISYVWCVCTYS